MLSAILNWFVRIIKRFWAVVVLIPVFIAYAFIHGMTLETIWVFMSIIPQIPHGKLIAAILVVVISIVLIGLWRLTRPGPIIQPPGNLALVFAFISLVGLLLLVTIIAFVVPQDPSPCTFSALECTAIATSNTPSVTWNTPTVTPSTPTVAPSTSTAAPSTPTAAPSTPTAAPSATPRSGEENLETNTLRVLCAFDALDASTNKPMPSSAYISLARYYSDPNLSDILERLQRQEGSFAVDFATDSCSKTQQIITTESGENTAAPQVVTFKQPDLSQFKAKRVWVIASASHTESLPAEFRASNVSIGEINGNFQNGSHPLGDIILGNNIADWAFQGKNSTFYGTEEQETITRFASDDSQAPKLLRIWFGYDAQDWLDQGVPKKRPVRAAQLFALRLDIPQALWSEPISSVSVKDKIPGDPSLDILAVIFVPTEFSDRAPTPTKTDASICLKSVSSNSIYISRRDFFADVREPEQVYDIKPDCRSVKIPELDQEIHFTFGQILETIPDTNNSSVIKLNITNTINATHMYFLLSARSLCYNTIRKFGIGEIVIQTEEGERRTVDLKITDNIRQGRTNVSCNNGDAFLLMADEKQQDQNPRGISSYPGVPIRARPDAERTSNKPAELWLDMVKVPIPKSKRFIIEIRNNPTKLQGNDPFITLYAATLVREEGASTSP